MGRLTRTSSPTGGGREVAEPEYTNLALVALPTVVSGFNYSHAVALPLALIVLSVFLAKDQAPRLRPTWAAAILPASALFIMIRPNYPTAKLDAVFFAVVLIAFTRAIFTSRSRAAALISLHDGVGVLLITSVALWFAGMRPVSRDDFGSNVFTGGERILFPLTSTLAIAPTIAAAYVAAFLPILTNTRRFRGVRFIALLAAAFVLVQADRRAALIAAILVTVAVIAIPRTFRRIAPWAIGLALTTPIVVGTSNTLRDFLTTTTNSVTPLKRTGETYETLNGRLGIWEKALNFYQDRIDPIHQAVGYGTWGHLESGVSSTYYSIFTGLYRERALKSPHSSVLQVLFDGGWITALSYTAALVGAAWIMARRFTTGDLAGLSMLATVAMVGATENTLAPHLTAIPFWMLVVIVTITFSREYTPAPQGDNAPPGHRVRSPQTKAPDAIIY